MEARVTMRIDAQVLKEAQKYAKRCGISLDGLTEILLRKAVADEKDVVDIHISDWVSAVSEGESTYVFSGNRRGFHREYYESRR